MYELMLLMLAIGFVIALGRGHRHRREIQELRRRIEELERSSRDERAPRDAGAPEQPPPGPISAPRPPLAVPDAPHPVPPPAPRSGRPFNLDRLEDVIGGVWLQNLGTVLLLVGAFFLIVWGWTTGRFGPGVLVVSGVLVGGILAWRGDRLRRTIPGLGHAFIGIGIGVVYVTLYLGHFTLRVLPAPAAVAALVAVSALALAAGLRYGVQEIAALGVVGAYLPQLLSGLLRLKGFALEPAALLAWIAAVSVLVFVLAARAGWSALDLSALALASVTWVLQHPQVEWGWPVTIGLAVLFTSLGLAPLPRLVRTEGRVRPLDLAVVAAAPVAFIVSAWPMLAFADARLVAMLLVSLAAVYAAATLWVDARRPERDLWRPLSAAAAVLLAAAFERALGNDYTPLAWTVEGAVLVWLGLAPRSGWLRAFGGVALAAGAMWGLVQLVASLLAAPAPLMSPMAVRTLVILAIVLVTAHLLHRRRETLTLGERNVPEIVAGAGHLLFVIWIAHEAGALARVLEGPGGLWQRRPDILRPPAGVRADALARALSCLAWTLQAAWLVRRGTTTAQPALRVLAAVLLWLASLGSLLTFVNPDPWSRDWLPALHLPGLLHLAAIGVAMATAAWLAARRGELATLDRRLPELWAFAAAIALLGWITREADHVARALLNLPGSAVSTDAASAATLGRRAALAPVLTSVGWLIQALATMAAGWWRRSAFLRWMGLALVALTALKFVFRDLAGADPFWRFLTAMTVGAVMLAMSWAYQRGRRGGVAPASADSP